MKVYRFAGSYYFINNEHEGKIILGSGGNREIPVYKYVSHLEETTDLTEEEEERYIEYLDNNFELILNAKEL